MNENLIEIVRQYLQIDTNYAMIINGEYGTGKTHFFKNELSKAIKAMPLPKDARKTFVPIHISLFGLKTIEEIQTEIFIELYPILRHKKLKLAAGIGKSIIRGIIGDISEYISDLNATAETWLNYDELVLCFDDLDRKSDNLNIKDIFGFINSLVENQAAKILIIANERQLLKDPQYNSELREKVIGVSIQYKPDSGLIFDQIISSKYKSADKIYFQFLSDNRQRILEVIELNENNFRNLIFFLEHFKIIFYSLRVKFSEDKTLRAQEEEKFQAILNFSISISIEYKLGNINVSNFKDIAEFDNHPLANFRLDKFFDDQNKKSKETNEEVKEAYIETFRKKYFPKQKYYFFKSIFEYILGLKAFSVEALLLELQNHFISKDGVIPEGEKILQELGYRNCFNLTDVRYKELTNEMLKFADSGAYKLQQYATVFHFAIRFNNLLNFSIPKLKKRLKSGIDIAAVQHQYTENLEFYMSIDEKTEFKEDLIEVIKYCIQKNSDMLVKSEADDLKETIALFLKDHDKFLEKVQGEHSEYRFKPFWLEIGSKKTFQLIKQLNNEQLHRLRFYFSRRYRRHIYEKLFPEKDFLIELDELINNPTKQRKKKNLRNASLDSVSIGIREAIANFP